MKGDVAKPVCAGYLQLPKVGNCALPFE